MTDGAYRMVRGYRLALDRAYDRDTHVWVSLRGEGRVRLGLDPLGVETTGSVAQLAVVRPGAPLARGDQFGSIEAEKFVGPLVTPVSGVLSARNDAAIADPGLLHRDPFGEGWLAEMDAPDLAFERERLVEGPDEVVAWFEEKVDAYRLKGVLAE